MRARLVPVEPQPIPPLLFGGPNKQTLAQWRRLRYLAVECRNTIRTNWGIDSAANFFMIFAR